MTAITMMVHILYDSNENQIWCVNIWEYMVFGSIVGSDYYYDTSMPPRVLLVDPGHHFRERGGDYPESIMVM